MVAQDWVHAGISLKRDTQNIEEEQETLTPPLRTVLLVDGEGKTLEDA